MFLDKLSIIVMLGMDIIIFIINFFINHKDNIINMYNDFKDFRAQLAKSIAINN